MSRSFGLRASQRRWPGLYHRDLAAPGGGNGSHLGADPARPDDHQPQSRREHRPQAQRVVKRAQQALRARARQRHRRRAGRQHQAVVGILGAAGAQHAVGDSDGRLTQPDFGAKHGQVSPQRSVIRRPGQHALGQRRPVVRRPGLGADQRHRARISPGPQLLQGAQARQPGSGYHHSLNPHDHLG
jgi:hypothetical protein